MWVKQANAESYRNLDNYVGLGVGPVTSGPRSGQWVIGSVSDPLAYFLTEQEALNALKALMTEIGYKELEGTA